MQMQQWIYTFELEATDRAVITVGHAESGSWKENVYTDFLPLVLDLWFKNIHQITLKGDDTDADYIREVDQVLYKLGFDSLPNKFDTVEEM